MFKNNLILYLVLFLSTLLSIYFRLYEKIGTDFYLFWDSMVLYCGPYFFSIDRNPYSLINECSERVSNFKYVYLPVYLEWFQFFLNISQKVFFQFWVLLVTTSLLLTNLFLNKIFDFSNYFLSLFILLFSFSGIPFYGFLTGNVSIFLYMICSLGILLTTNKQNSIVLLGLVLIALTSMFKIYMLIFLLVPYVFLERKYIKHIVILSIFVSSFFISNYFIYKSLFQEFLNNLSILPIAGDMGVGLIKIVNQINYYILNISELYNTGKHNWNIDPSLKFNMIPDYILLLVIVLLFFYLATKIRNYKFSDLKEENIRTKIALGIIISYLCLPRLKQYDFFLNTLASFYIINSDVFKNLIIKRFNSRIYWHISFSLNLAILAFYNIKGDNFFIYPFTLLLLVLFMTFYGIEKKKASTIS